MDNEIANNEKPMSVSDWFITILILGIPLVNLIMYLVWAFSSGTNLNKKNFCKATLIWILIGIVLGIVYGVAIATFIGAGLEPAIDL
jgi:hypothetical protein